MNRNIALPLAKAALEHPHKRCVVEAVGRPLLGRRYSHFTFGQMENFSRFLAGRFREAGISRGSKVLMLMRPGIEFAAAAFAVFKTGAAPVMIDPGMGKKSLLKCIADTAPDAMIAESVAHWVARVFPKPFANVRARVSRGGLPPPGTSLSIDRLRAGFDDSVEHGFESEFMTDDDLAAILFTTGSTGPPKGVVYTHGMFNAQLDIIRESYGAGPSEIDMSAFPLFALFAVSLGMTSVVPDMDFTRPARVDPRKIVRIVRDHGVSFSFASPALWRVVAGFCLENNIRLDSVRRALMAGAPVNAELHDMVRRVISPEGDVFVPFGATEVLPMATFTGSEMLSGTAALSAAGAGYCVGRPSRGVSVRIVSPRPGAIESVADAVDMSVGDVGEIIVKGPVVSREYYGRPRENALSKIKDPDGRVWHRMGDMGRLDTEGRLWFCGRRNHVVETGGGVLYPVCVESIFNTHPDVFRTALVGVGEAPSQTPVLIVEPKPGRMPRGGAARDKFVSELRKLASANEMTRDVGVFLFHRSFPVDIRHNAKIFREKLRVWASSRVR